MLGFPVTFCLGPRVDRIPGVVLPAELSHTDWLVDFGSLIIEEHKANRLIECFTSDQMYVVKRSIFHIAFPQKPRLRRKSRILTQPFSPPSLPSLPLWNSRGLYTPEWCSAAQLATLGYLDISFYDAHPSERRDIASSRKTCPLPGRRPPQGLAFRQTPELLRSRMTPFSM
ncbi:hypothetical protein P152DRAFT_498256 [Eremomyces bilateralis CBS 781.70]|uniref:Uncharacterized protein n=1 Tax=Eremomyces bilateralis CBS 781.70 TaxID=1392243 RepID=A0A6G1G9Z1_9PEZI|nr:uncharacterized protein P152DRAFT_498256 [Eremomyces bilateralis CBS 781.70]KAF1814730.1 hypothetical protein P152DRAFT_498256 [Eremomyces bilateralis CBS 781.70]